MARDELQVFCRIFIIHIVMKHYTNSGIFRDQGYKESTLKFLKVRNGKLRPLLNEPECHIKLISRLGLSDYILEAKIDPFECNSICTQFSIQISFEAIRIYFRSGTKN